MNPKDMLNVTQVVPSKMEKYIKENKSRYGRRIEQLGVIIADNSYIPKGSENTYHEFIFSMWQALVTGRRITPKMESAITKIVKVYAKHLKKENDPEYRKNKLSYIETTLNKLNSLKGKLHTANYSKSYESNSEYFLNSISEHVKARGSLTVKQRKALNKMHNQFTKRIEKNNGV
jgi:hypothetical protein|tara:strand:- start:799 stop:1323 length:525 start_codon:yes stop_codon:yes gene_type:complete